MTKIAREMNRLFGPLPTIRVKMLYTREVNRFVRKVEAAHKATDKSKLVFKGG